MSTSLRMDVYFSGTYRDKNRPGETCGSKTNVGTCLKQIFMLSGVSANVIVFDPVLDSTQDSEILRKCDGETKSKQQQTNGRFN